MSRMTKLEAQEILKSCEIDPATDYHALYSGKTALLGLAGRKRGYRRPRNANGSYARCFHAYIMRVIG